MIVLATKGLVDNFLPAIFVDFLLPGVIGAFVFVLISYKLMQHIGWI